MQRNCNTVQKCINPQNPRLFPPNQKPKGAGRSFWTISISMSISWLAWYIWEVFTTLFIYLFSILGVILVTKGGRTVANLHLFMGSYENILCENQI